jgi:hypothetical protein
MMTAPVPTHAVRDVINVFVLSLIFIFYISLLVRHCCQTAVPVDAHWAHKRP